MIRFRHVRRLVAAFFRSRSTLVRAVEQRTIERDRYYERCRDLIALDEDQDREIVRLRNEVVGLRRRVHAAEATAAANLR